MTAKMLCCGEKARSDGAPRNHIMVIYGDARDVVSSFDKQMAEKVEDEMEFRPGFGTARTGRECIC